MGRYLKGILGSFNGKIGTVIGSTWKGIDYMKSLPKKSKKAPSDKQMIQRVKFALISSFLQPISTLVNLGYKNVATNVTGYNAATSQIFGSAITGTYPDFGIDFSKVLISKGILSIPSNVSLSSPASGKIRVNWDNNSGSGVSNTTDKAIILVVNPETLLNYYTTSGDTRNSGGQTLDLVDFKGQEVHIWMAFISEDGNTLSTSVYAGSIEVTA